MGAQGLGMPDIWGSHGTAQGEFDSPAAVATDGQYVYVADTGNHRVVKFTTNGIFVLQWIYPGQLNGIAVDLAGGVVYVSDSAFHVIQQFSASGASGPRLGTYGSSGSLDGQFNSPTGIATDALGNLYVADTGNQRIQKFDKWGTFLAKWGTSGNADGSLCDPNGIATYAGHVFVSDSCNDRIQEFDASGIFVAKWGAAGGGDGQLISPTGIAVAAGNVYVVDSGNQRIQEFSATTHSFVTSWGSPVSRAGTGYGEFANPRGVATSSAYVGSAGWVYIADTGNHRIHKVKF